MNHPRAALVSRSRIHACLSLKYTRCGSQHYLGVTRWCARSGGKKTTTIVATDELALAGVLRSRFPKFSEYVRQSAVGATSCGSAADFNPRAIMALFTFPLTLPPPRDREFDIFETTRHVGPFDRTFLSVY